MPVSAGGGGGGGGSSLLAVYARPHPPRRGAATVGPPTPGATPSGPALRLESGGSLRHESGGAVLLEGTPLRQPPGSVLVAARREWPRPDLAGRVRIAVDQGGPSPPQLWRLDPLRPVATARPVRNLSTGFGGWTTSGGDDSHQGPLILTQAGYRLCLENGSALMPEGSGTPPVPQPGGRTTLAIAASPRRLPPGRASVALVAPILGPEPSATPLDWSIARSPRRLPPGAAKVVRAQEGPPPPKAWSPIQRPQSSPRRLPPGRARVGIPTPAVASGDANFRVRPALRPIASPRHLPPGRASVGRWPPEPSDQAQTPLMWLLRPSSSPRHLHGGSAWTPAQPRSTSDQRQTPLLWILRPAARRGDVLARRPRGGHYLPTTARPPAPPPKLSTWAPLSRRGEGLVRRRRGATWSAANPRLPFDSTSYGEWYNVYGVIPGTAARIPYGGSPLASTPITTWGRPQLAVGPNSFGVRAANQYGEELNLDCEVTILIDATGRDVTARPLAPIGLRALPRPGGAIRVEWFHGGAAVQPAGPSLPPTGFHVYMGAGSTVDYTSPIATVPYDVGYFGTFVANIPAAALPGDRGRLRLESGGGFLLQNKGGLLGQAWDEGDVYAVGVRAYNGSGEEPNTDAVTVTAEAVGPPPVADLMGVAIT